MEKSEFLRDRQDNISPHCSLRNLPSPGQGTGGGENDIQGCSPSLYDVRTVDIADMLLLFQLGVMLIRHPEDLFVDVFVVLAQTNRR